MQQIQVTGKACWPSQSDIRHHQLLRKYWYWYGLVQRFLLMVYIFDSGGWVFPEYDLRSSWKSAECSPWRGPDSPIFVLLMSSYILVSTSWHQYISIIPPNYSKMRLTACRSKPWSHMITIEPTWRLSQHMNPNPMNMLALRLLQGVQISWTNVRMVLLTVLVNAQAHGERMATVPITLVKTAWSLRSI